jgi:hypothetical protein
MSSCNVVWKSSVAVFVVLGALSAPRSLRAASLHAGTPLVLSGPDGMRLRADMKASAGSHETESVVGGLEDAVRFARRPRRERVSYRLELEHVAGLRLLANTLELLDAGGAPRLRVRAPFVVDSRGVQHRALLVLRGCAYDHDATGPWARAVTAPGRSDCTLDVQWGKLVGAPIQYPATLDPAWVDGGKMVRPRNYHTGVRMADGRVLVAGGYLAVDSSDYTTAAEIYDPSTNTWAATTDMNRGRAHFRGALFTKGSKAGQIIVASGDTALLPSAEIYDPKTAKWTDTAPMLVGRDEAESVLLGDGRFLVAGGCTLIGPTTCTTIANDGEVYDPEADKWTNTGPMSDPRTWFTLTALADGRAFAFGGCVQYGDAFQCDMSTASGDVFDLATSKWTKTAPAPFPAELHSAALLADGGVLVAGGTSNGVFLSGAAIYDATKDTWKKSNLPGSIHVSTEMARLPSGKVLIIGSVGTTQNNFALSGVCEVYDPAANTWTPTVLLSPAMALFSVTTLSDGAILVAGGLTTAAGDGTTQIENGRGFVYRENPLVVTTDGGAGAGGDASVVDAGSDGANQAKGGSSGADAAAGAAGLGGAGGGGSTGAAGATGGSAGAAGAPSGGGSGGVGLAGGAGVAGGTTGMAVNTRSAGGGCQLAPGACDAGWAALVSAGLSLFLARRRRRALTREVA